MSKYAYSTIVPKGTNRKEVDDFYTKAFTGESSTKIKAKRIIIIGKYDRVIKPAIAETKTTPAVPKQVEVKNFSVMVCEGKKGMTLQCATEIIAAEKDAIYTKDDSGIYHLVKPSKVFYDQNGFLPQGLTKTGKKDKNDKEIEFDFRYFAEDKEKGIGKGTYHAVSGVHKPIASATYKFGKASELEESTLDFLLSNTHCITAEIETED